VLNLIQERNELGVKKKTILTWKAGKRYKFLKEEKNFSTSLKKKTSASVGEEWRKT